MDWLEEELKQALARKDPRPDFATRVGAAARRRAAPGMRRWMAAAAAVLVIAGGGMAYRRHQGMAAKERVMLAMRITSGKLQHIQTHMREARP